MRTAGKQTAPIKPHGITLLDLAAGLKSLSLHPSLATAPGETTESEDLAVRNTDLRGVSQLK
jgi:hypothetical protein